MELDRTWFEQHPGATMRIRCYVPGELWPCHDQGGGDWVIVCLIGPGLRTRQRVNVPVGDVAE